MMAALDRPFDEVIATYERASQTVPARAEALHAAAITVGRRGRMPKAMEFARRGLESGAAETGFSFSPGSTNTAFSTSSPSTPIGPAPIANRLMRALKLLASEKLPPSMVKRIAANARFAADKLPAAKAPDLGTLGAEDLLQQHALVRSGRCTRA